MVAAMANKTEEKMRRSHRIQLAYELGNSQHVGYWSGFVCHHQNHILSE